MEGLCQRHVALGGNGKQAGGSGVVRIMTAAGNGKRQARLPVDHFEKLLKEACPNHAYPHQAQAQGLQHDEEFHGIGVPHLRHGTR
jgi:hypothetical protein